MAFETTETRIDDPRTPREVRTTRSGGNAALGIGIGIVVILAVLIGASLMGGADREEPVMTEPATDTAPMIESDAQAPAVESETTAPAAEAETTTEGSTLESAPAATEQPAAGEEAVPAE